jgi:hypothetical protein
MSIGQLQQPYKRLALCCTKCGSIADASCDCGSPYIPARERAAQAIAANPEKSDRAIAAEIGVGAMTVNRARATVPDGTVDERVGLDGKTRRLPQRAEPEPKSDIEDEIGIEDEIEPKNYRTAFLFLAAG